ncbi:MAG TPA: tetratricopeptide repeat protein, partial [Longimicrobiaceae bacterium]|nr:tetratricopeptide repeat protein [Longimicrobiaceae bacterium]
TEARSEFERLLKQTNDPRTHVNVAWTYLYGPPKDLAAAETECRRALDLNPSSAEALGCLGVSAARRREPYQAEHHLRRSLELRPSSRTHADLAEVLIQDERYDEAGKEIEEALKIDPGDAHAHAQKGNLLLQRELPDQALPEFRRAVSLDPSDPDVHAALAAALMELGRDDDAEKVLRAALRKGGWAGRWKLHLLLCQRLTRLGDDTGEKDHYRDALGEANRAIHAVPHHPAPHYHAGVVRFKLEDYPGALGSFRRCTELDPDDGDAILGAGKVRGVLRRERDRSRVSRAESWGLALLFSIMLVVLWVLRVRTDKVDSNVFLTLNILLPGLLIASRMLPWLTHFRFTGLEVELSAPPAKDLLVTGPRGEVGFSRPPRVPV